MLTGEIQINYVNSVQQMRTFFCNPVTAQLGSFEFSFPVPACSVCDDSVFLLSLDYFEISSLKHSVSRWLALPLIWTELVAVIWLLCVPLFVACLCLFFISPWLHSQSYVWKMGFKTVDWISYRWKVVRTMVSVSSLKYIQTVFLFPKLDSICILLDIVKLSRDDLKWVRSILPTSHRRLME